MIRSLIPTPRAPEGSAGRGRDGSAGKDEGFVAGASAAPGTARGAPDRTRVAIASSRGLRRVRRLRRSGLRLALLQVEVGDDAAGLPSDVVSSASLWEPYARLGDGGDAVSADAGLALAIVRSVVADHMGGEVGLCSDVDRGTVLFARVPVWVREIAPAELEREQRRRGSVGRRDSGGPSLMEEEEDDDDEDEEEAGRWRRGDQHSEGSRGALGGFSAGGQSWVAPGAGPGSGGPGAGAGAPRVDLRRGGGGGGGGERGDDPWRHDGSAEAAAAAAAMAHRPPAPGPAGDQHSRRGRRPSGLVGVATAPPGQIAAAVAEPGAAVSPDGGERAAAAVAAATVVSGAGRVRGSRRVAPSASFHAGQSSAGRAAVAGAPTAVVGHALAGGSAGRAAVERRSSLSSRSQGGSDTDRSDTAGESAATARRPDREERRRRREQRQAGRARTDRGSASSRGAKPLRGRSVYVADDDATTRSLLSTLSRRRLGAEVTSFGDGRELMERLVRDAGSLLAGGRAAVSSLPAALLVDNRMPRLGAAGVLQEIAALQVGDVPAELAELVGSEGGAGLVFGWLCHVPVIVVTGDVDAGTRATMTRLGAAATLGKPVDADALLETVTLAVRTAGTLLSLSPTSAGAGAAARGRERGPKALPPLSPPRQG